MTSNALRHANWNRCILVGVRISICPQHDISTSHNSRSGAATLQVADSVHVGQLVRHPERGRVRGAVPEMHPIGGARPPLSPVSPQQQPPPAPPRSVVADSSSFPLIVATSPLLPGPGDLPPQVAAVFLRHFIVLVVLRVAIPLPRLLPLRLRHAPIRRVVPGDYQVADARG